MGGGVWQATALGVAESQTRLTKHIYTGSITKNLHSLAPLAPFSQFYKIDDPLLHMRQLRHNELR